MGILSKLFGPRVDLKEIVQRGAQIIDVRTPGEFSQGHGKKSKNIPLDQLSKKIDSIRKADKPVITCCASGMRSGAAARMLKGYGIEAYNGGSWQNTDQIVKSA